MREIRLYGSEGGGTGCSPYPYQQVSTVPLDSRFRGNDAPERFCSGKDCIITDITR